MCSHFRAYDANGSMTDQYIGAPAAVNGQILLHWDGVGAYVTAGDSLGGILSGAEGGLALLSPSISGQGTFANQPLNYTDWLLYDSPGPGQAPYSLGVEVNSAGMFTVVGVNVNESTTLLSKYVTIPTVYNLLAQAHLAGETADGETVLTWVNGSGSGSGAYMAGGSVFNGDDAGVALVNPTWANSNGYSVGTDWLVFASNGSSTLLVTAWLKVSLSSSTFTPVGTFTFVNGTGITETFSMSGTSGDLPASIQIPSDYNLFGLTSLQQVNVSSGSVTLSWNNSWDGHAGGAYATSATAAGIIQDGDPGIALISPADATYYGGNGTDWLVYESNGSSTFPTTAWLNVCLSTSTFTPMGTFSFASAMPSAVDFTVGFSPTPGFSAPLPASISGSGAFTVSTSTNNYSNVYTYDLNSNRLSEVHTGPGDTAAMTAIGTTTLYYYNGDDELISQLAPGTAGYSFSYSPSTYDANGSMTDQYTGAPASNNAFGTFAPGTAFVSSNVTSTVSYAFVTTGSTGTIVTDVNGGNYSAALAETTLPGGDILVAGYGAASGEPNGSNDIVLAAYNPSTGLPDTSFGSGGFVMTHVDGNSTANAVMVSGGTIWIAGADTSDKDAILASYSTLGVPLTLTTTAIESGQQASWNAMTMSGSNILVTGYGTDSSDNQYVAVGEYNTSGTLVSTFGTSGIVLTDTDGGGSGNAILVSGSSIWVAGGSNYNRTAILVQYNSSGAFNQYVRSPVSSNATWNAMALSGSDIVVAGVANSGTISLAEYNTAGNLVTSFGTGGIVMTNIGGNATANAIMVETSGKILVTGTGQETYLHTNGSSYTTTEVALVQYQSNGALDPTFGTDGIALPMVVPNVVSAGYAVNMLSNGNIVVAGQIEDPSDGHDIFVAEYTIATSPSTTYTYDVRNKMVGFSSTTGTASYVYDDNGNRVQETTGGTTSFYLTDTANPTGYAQPIEVWTSTNGSLSNATLNTTYLIGDRIFGQDVAGTLSYLQADGHGNTRLITNGTGTLINVLNYDAFGNALNFNASAPPTMFLYSDGAVDLVSGLKMCGDGTRDEDIPDDIFIESDSPGFSQNSDPMSLHKYLYADADPINGLDASGHDDDAFDDIGGIASEDFGALETIGAAGLFGLNIGGTSGGPDITAELTGIAKFILSYNQPHKQALPSTGILYASWDIYKLSQWGSDDPPDPNAPGIVTINGRTFSTVTVAGYVYRPEEVNYFLWGLWNRATSSSLAYALMRVHGYRSTVYGDAGNGRQDWTEAGYYDNFGLASTSAISGLTLGQPYGRDLGFHIGDLYGNADASGNVT